MSAAERRAGGPWTEPAPAKINLYLEVLHRRPDGYHELDSLAVFADMGEIVSAVPAGALSLEIGGPQASGLAAEPDNLILRAARLLRAEAGLSQGAAFRLEKHIPVAAGLGGGSADAAAALRLLNRLWGLDWPLGRLEPLARQLGADVPVCLYARPAIMRGVGDSLRPAPALPPLHLLLANPGVPVSTAAIFPHVAPRGTPARDFDIPSGAEGAEAFYAALAARDNDLAGPARRLAPAISDCLHLLSSLPAARLARMSGSGASCFALFSDEAALRRAATILRWQAPDWFIKTVTLI